MASYRRRKIWVDQATNKRFYSASQAKAWAAEHPEAEIEERTQGWQARINRAGEAPVARTFPTRREAQYWAEGVEDDMEAGIWGEVSARQHRPLREALDWYRDNVSCHRMGAASERYRLQCLRDELGAILIAQLDAPRIVPYVRRRLEHVCGDTLRRELGLPIRFIGTGEQLDDLEPFDARRFAESLLD